MGTVNTKWFQLQLSSRGLSQRRLAQMINLDPSSVSLMLRGKREMKTSEAAQIANLLGVPISEVLQNAGVPGSSQTVPVVGYLDGTGEVILDLDKPFDRVPGGVELPGNAIAIVARTAATPLQHMDGWIFYVEPPSGGERSVPPDIIGRMALVQLSGSQARHIRSVSRGYKRDTYNLTAPGMVAIENVDLDWATPILLIKP